MSAQRVMNLVVKAALCPSGLQSKVSVDIRKSVVDAATTGNL